MELFNAMQVSASGMKAQGARVRVIAENIANANSIAEGPAKNPIAGNSLPSATKWIGHLASTWSKPTGSFG